MEKRYCKLCHKELSEKQIKRNKFYCGRSCALKAAYQNPEVRQRVSEATKKALNKPEVRKRHIEGSKKAFQNPEVRQKMSDISKAVWANEEYRQKMSKIRKDTWKKAEYRQKMSKIRKDTWQKEEVRQKFSKSMSAKWSEFGYKERVSQNIRKTLNEPEIKKKLSDSIKRSLNRPETKEKQKRANKELANRLEVKLKSYNTKKQNHSFNTSKPETEIFKLLQQVFKDIQTQYRSKDYPFNCDFYIPSLDLYIELNFHWTHGGRQFDENDKDCLSKLAQWQVKAKTSKFYKNAIETWTIRDTKKRQIAEDNKLNWLCFYTYVGFLNWYNSKVKYD